MRDRLYRVEAVIIKRTDVGEADRLLTLFTAERGKLRVIAKGARKPSSHKSGHVELFNHVNLLIAKGRNLDLITQAETLDSYLPLRGDLDRLGYETFVNVMAANEVRIEELDQALRRIARERERQARVILGESEKQIAASFADASQSYINNPTALHLRAMNMLFEGLKEKGSLMIIPSSAIDSMNLGVIGGLAALGKTAMPGSSEPMV